MKFHTSEVLQEIFDNSDQQNMLGEQANELIATGDECHDDPGELYLAGVERGFDLAVDLKAVKGIKGNENAGIYQLTYTGYAPTHGPVQDGVALFVGTHRGLSKMFIANPKPN